MLYLCPFGKIGAVVAGIKPAELVKLDSLCVNCLKENNPNLNFFYLARSFYLVYNSSLKETLVSPCVKEVLSILGYSDNPRISLARLKRRFQTSCPPEVGFFLGYPPKDVLGFMGIPGFVYAKTLGWRMYEPVAVSEMLYKRYKRARSNTIVTRCTAITKIK